MPFEGHCSFCKLILYAVNMLQPCASTVFEKNAGEDTRYILLYLMGFKSSSFVCSPKMAVQCKLLWKGSSMQHSVQSATALSVIGVEVFPARNVCIIDTIRVHSRVLFHKEPHLILSLVCVG